MPITIGAKAAPGFANPLELLSDCHRRIERFLAVLMTIAEQANGGRMADQHKREWMQALEYFRNAAPRHTADEEESLFPRLRQIDGGQVRKALAEVEELETDHENAAKWHEEVDRLGSKWLLQATLVASDTQQLRDTLSRLNELYGRHIAVEDKSLFPFAATVLPDEAKEKIGVEMAQRRGIDPDRIPERLPKSGRQVE